MTSLNLRVFSLPKAIILAITAATVLKNNPPNKNDIAKLINGALYIVCTTVSVVTVVAISTACAATSNAASVAALAVFVRASVAVSARTPEILSGANNQADAYRVCVVVVDDADDTWSIYYIDWYLCYLLIGII